MSNRLLIRIAVCVSTLIGGLTASGVLMPVCSGAAEAISGRPFGVGTIEVPLTAGNTATFWETGALRLEEAGGRVFYPVIRSGLGEGRILGGLLGTNEIRPDSVTLSFLFVGDAPLEIRVQTPEMIRQTLVPRRESPRGFQRALNRWWRDYHAAVRTQSQQNDYPPLPHTYLTAMLGRRLGLAPPLLSRTREPADTELKQTVELLLGNEASRTAIAHQMMSAGEEIEDQATIPLAEEIVWASPSIPDLEDVEVEPIARHVPAECFYIRFGSFNNYLWFSKLMREVGGEASALIALRGQDARLNDRFQYQIGLKETKLAELFGDRIIADVALVGRDLYLADGAAMGVLFQAKNSAALESDLRQKLVAALKLEAENGSRLETVQLAGRPVTFVSTPDNRLRSYYAIDGDFHLVTTSQALAERFLTVGEGRNALADSPEFRHARAARPVDREDTIFAFFSSTFFQGLLSPQYQVELRRRQRAAAAIDLAQMAQWAARAEGHPSDSLEDLQQGGFLPGSVNRLVDGSGPLLETDRVMDSLRGAKGTFKPIPDIPVRGMTPREAAAYESTAAYFAENWRQFDPLLVTVQRHAGDESGLEHLDIEANVSPLAEEKYGWILSMLGPPSTHWVAPAPGDIISMQAMVQGGLLRPTIAPHHVFVGIQDAPLASDVRPTGLLETLELLRSTPGYLGSWPKLGFLDLLPFRLGGVPDPHGFSKLPLGLWRWQGGGFSVLSFQPQVLEHVAPHLRPEPTNNPAQIRIQVGDLSSSQLAGNINLMGYERARQASMGNARLLHMLSQQFHLPREEAKAAAEELLQAELICSLGGDYRIATRQGLDVWSSTAWFGEDATEPMSYQAPLLTWFRGMRVDLTKYGDRMVMQAHVDLQREPAGSKFELPFLDFFSGGGREDSGALTED